MYTAILSTEAQPARSEMHVAPVPSKRRLCSCRSSPCAHADCASSGCANLVRALSAEAEVRRLRGLVKAAYESSLSAPAGGEVAFKLHEAKQKPVEEIGGRPFAKCRRTNFEGSQEVGSLTLVKCADLLYTQNTCKGVFADGISLESVVKELVEQKRDPLADPWFILDVVEWEGRWYSVDNRRLYCLSRYQMHLGCSRTVWVRVRLHRWREVFDRFWLHFTTINGGESIRIRNGDLAHQ